MRLMWVEDCEGERAFPKEWKREKRPDGTILIEVPEEVVVLWKYEKESKNYKGGPGSLENATLPQIVTQEVLAHWYRLVSEENVIGAHINKGDLISFSDDPKGIVRWNYGDQSLMNTLHPAGSQLV